LITSVSIVLPGGGASLMCVGNPAPPMPTMPASETSEISFFGSRLSQSGCGTIVSTHASWPSGSISTASAFAPVAVSASSTDLTVPEVGACTLADRKPPCSPIAWPRSTLSPFLTSGLAGTPRCCSNDTRRRAGNGMAAIGWSAVRRL
jgi:hypothetical protein